MPPETASNYYMQYVGAVLISLVSGFLSIARRILKGTKASLLWIISEMVAAVMVGLLAWDSYPDLSDIIPHEVSQLVFACMCSYLGSRLLHVSEMIMEVYLSRIKNGPK